MKTSSGESRMKQWLSHLLPPANTKSKSSNANGQAPQDASRLNDTISAGLNSKHNHIVQPPPAVSKDGPHVNITGTVYPPNPTDRRPTEIELDTIDWGQPLSGPENTTTQRPNDIESNPNSGRTSPAPSASTSSSRQVIATIQPSFKHPYMNRWRILACCIAFFTQGMNDSAPGALLPYMERYYNVRYAMVSLIFVANACGFIIAAPVCHMLNNRFGRAKVLAACTGLNAVAYIALVCQPPFAVVVISFLLLGYGFATILALDNVFIINLSGGTVLLGYMHGCYGIGGVVAPFVATGMVSTGIRWSYFYAIPLAMSVVSTAAFFLAFRSYETENASTQLRTTIERTLSRQTTSEEKKSILKKTLRNRTTLLGALLIFAYQGAEVAISGWVISFLIDYRNGNPAQVGYVTSGFWGGITLGRFLLVTPAHKIGDRISIVVLVAGTATFQFMVWFLPNVIGNAVAVAIIGFLLGPIYPCATGVFSKLLPSHLQITSLGFISSMGSSGGALGPLATGLLAQKLGTVVLNPICIVLCVVMEVAWLCLPRVVKRRE